MSELSETQPVGHTSIYVLYENCDINWYDILNELNQSLKSFDLLFIFCQLCFIQNRFCFVKFKCFKIKFFHIFRFYIHEFDDLIRDDDFVSISRSTNSHIWLFCDLILTNDSQMNQSADLSNLICFAIMRFEFVVIIIELNNI